MNDIILKAENLAISYGKFKITDVDFKLKGGDVMGLVGRSGSGKSTIIKCLLGLKTPNSGSIQLFSDNSKVSLKRYIGYSPQENSLFPFLTLEENLRTFGNLYNLTRKSMEEQMTFLLKRLDLEKSRHKRIAEMSGGMQKRADIAVSLLHSPKVVLLDEPFNGLDVSLQKFTWTLLKELAQEGKIIIVSSHMLSDVQKNCNEFGLVEGGKFYNTKQLIQNIKLNKFSNLSLFLEKLFEEEVGK